MMHSQLWHVRSIIVLSLLAACGCSRTSRQPTAAAESDVLGTSTAPKIGEAATLIRANARVWFEPREPFSQTRFGDSTDPSDGLLLCGLVARYAPSRTAIPLGSVPDAGLHDPDDTSGDGLRFGKVVDENGRPVVRFRLVRGQAPVVIERHATHRSVISFDTVVGGEDVKHIPFGEETWVAWAIKSPAPAYRGKVEQGTDGSCGDQVMDLLSVSTSRAGDSSIYVGLLPGNVLHMEVRSNQGTTRATSVAALPVPDVPLADSGWNYLVLKLRLATIASQHPDTSIWFARGDSPPTPLYTSDEPNAWAPHPEQRLFSYAIMRTGPYLWCRSAPDAPPPDAWTPAGSDIITIDMGGLYVFPAPAVPGVSERDLVRFLQGQTP